MEETGIWPDSKWGACVVGERDCASLLPILDTLVVAGDEQVGRWGSGRWQQWRDALWTTSYLIR